jgi:hypothetical protein
VLCGYAALPMGPVLCCRGAPRRRELTNDQGKGTVLRRTICLSALSLALASTALVPATAGAATASPTSLDFGNTPVGTTSPPKPVTLTQSCTDLNCVMGVVSDPFGPSISASPAPSFTQTNDCPATLVALVTSASCTINVRFSPSSAGVANGTLASGGGGPTVALRGTGSAGGGGSGAGSSSAKKCKKHKKHKRSAHSAKKKKCKKHKSKKK